jgi:hypothetical protein
MNPAGDPSDACDDEFDLIEWDEPDWDKPSDWVDLKSSEWVGYTPTRDSRPYQIVGVASKWAVQIGKGVAQVKVGAVWIGAGAVWIGASAVRVGVEVVHVGKTLGSLVGPPVYTIILTIGACIYQITLSTLDAFCDGACWLGRMVGKGIWLYGSRVVITCCKLGIYLVCMIVVVGGQVVVYTASSIGCAVIGA